MVAIIRLKVVAFALGLVYSSAFLSPRSPLSVVRSGPTVSKLRLPNNAAVRLRQRRHASVHSSSARLASSSAVATTASNSDGKNTVIATLLLVLIDVRLRSFFLEYSIAFPSSLAGCGALFASMIALDTCSGGNKFGEKIYDRLNPGATLLAKWLPVFFVPSLITLPLASGLGNAIEMLKMFVVIIGGFFFTLFTTSYSVLWIRNLSGKNDGSASDNANQSASVQPTVTGKAAKPFSLTLFRTLRSLALINGFLTIGTTKLFPSSQLAKPFQSLFLLFTTLSGFVFGANLPKSFTKVVHPLLTCSCTTWLAIKGLALLTGSTFIGILQSYKSGTLAPLSAGAGDVLLFLLGPAVIALSCQMYSRKKLMRENISTVGVSTIVSSLGGLYGTAAAVRLVDLVNPTIRLSLLSRNITSPLAMAIASILGADISLAVTIVVLTGLFGANFGASILDAAGIKDPVARGLGIGAAAHGLGTAAFANEKDAFPFSAIAMALTASACTVLVSLPAVKRSVLKLALGV